MLWVTCGSVKAEIAGSNPVGAGLSKSGGTEVLRELNSLRTSAFYVGFVRFSEDFVCKRRPLAGVFVFNP